MIPSFVLKLPEARFFADQLRSARAATLKDSEDFDEIIFVLERLGGHLTRGVRLRGIPGLGSFEEHISAQAQRSPIAMDIPDVWSELFIRFDQLYKLVKNGRNDAMHQGAFARRLADHAVQISLVLEDALRRGYGLSKVGEYMVRNPIFGEIWHPVSFFRQIMLANSFSYLPVRKEDTWYLVSDLAIASFLMKAASETDRKKRLNMTVSEVGTELLKKGRQCFSDVPLSHAVKTFGSDPSPLLVIRNGDKRKELIGILTPFDVL